MIIGTFISPNCNKAATGQSSQDFLANFWSYYFLTFTRLPAFRIHTFSDKIDQFGALYMKSRDFLRSFISEWAHLGNDRCSLN